MDKTEEKYCIVGFETQQLFRSMVRGSFNEESDRYTHSVVTMDSASRHSEMAELKAELEAELELMDPYWISHYPCVHDVNLCKYQQKCSLGTY